MDLLAKALEALKTKRTSKGRPIRVTVACLVACTALLAACAAPQHESAAERGSAESQASGEVQEAQAKSTATSAPGSAAPAETAWNDIPLDSSSASSSAGNASASGESARTADELFAALDVVQDFRKSFVHGDKPDKFQKYIVLHDTEGDGDPEDIISYWDSSEEGIAAHFVIGKGGHVVQCVPLDKIAHHAGFGDTGHNKKFGVEDESRDDKVGTAEIGDWASDYGMNSYSVGIEMVHVGGEGDYPQEQLEALDALIAYLDAYYGRECEIIDHKMWRTGNSDTSEEFAEYLINYQKRRTHR